MLGLDATAEDTFSEPPAKKPRNAFTELMERKTPIQATPKPDRYSSITTTNPNDMTDIRNGLGVYIKHPETNGDSIITYDDDWVLIRDKYPKSLVHLLLLVRDPKIYTRSPQVACEDPEFLARLRVKAEDCIRLAASELSRLISPHSASSRERRLAMTSPDSPTVLPPGRDFTKEIMVGFHAGPSMNHLHLHIISRDRHSERIKHYKHYNSFNNDFFLQLDQFPYAADDVRRTRVYQGSMLKADFICWRCGLNCGKYNSPGSMKRLKTHLELEYKEWCRE